MKKTQRNRINFEMEILAGRVQDLGLERTRISVKGNLEKMISWQGLAQFKKSLVFLREKSKIVMLEVFQILLHFGGELWKTLS